MHALIIEDEPLVADLIEEFLRLIGFTTFSFAIEEAQAISAATDRRPDFITSDV